MAAHPRIQLVQGDITRISADAIVNAANSRLRGGGGVDGAIHRAGGPAIMADLEERYGSRRFCPTGSAVVSDAGNLPARVVIHAVGPVWNGGGEGESLLLADAHRNALDLVVAEACRTVTFPAISTGVYHYPVDAAAGVAIGTVGSWLDEHPDAVDLVTFVLFSGDALAVFDQALKGA